MSIRKKLMLFVFVIIIVPMVILFITSTIIMDKQKKDSELLYLQSALKIVRTQMLMRKAEMEKAGLRLAQNPTFRLGVRSGNERQLLAELIKLRQIYDYLDVAVVLDVERRPIARISEDLRGDMAWELDGLVQAVSEQRRSITSEEALPLEELFFPNSVSYNQFRIPIANRLDAAGIIDVPLQVQHVGRIRDLSVRHRELVRTADQLDVVHAECAVRVAGGAAMARSQHEPQVDPGRRFGHHARQGDEARAIDRGGPAVGHGPWRPSRVGDEGAFGSGQGPLHRHVGEAV